MRIRFGGRAALLLFLAGLVAVGWTPVAASLALGRPVLLVGPITFAGGGLLLAGLWLLRGATYVLVEDDRLVVHALIGPLTRTYRFSSFREVELRDGAVFITTNGSPRRIPIHRAQANADDWRAFERLVHQRSSGASA